MPPVMDTMTTLTEVFRDVFDDPSLTISRVTSAANIDAWDSLTHVSLLLAIEKRFGFRFTSSQVAALKNVGELIDLIEKKLAAR